MKRNLKLFWDTLSNEKLIEIDSWTFNNELNPMFAVYLVNRGIIPFEADKLINFLREKDRTQGKTMQKIQDLLIPV